MGDVASAGQVESGRCVRQHTKGACHPPCGASCYRYRHPLASGAAAAAASEKKIRPFAMKLLSLLPLAALYLINGRNFSYIVHPLLCDVAQCHFSLSVQPLAGKPPTRVAAQQSVRFAPRTGS